MKDVDFIQPKVLPDFKKSLPKNYLSKIKKADSNDSMPIISPQNDSFLFSPIIESDQSPTESNTSTTIVILLLSNLNRN